MKKKKTSTTLSTASDSDLKLNEIKKVLMCNDDSDSKVNDIHKIIYGYLPQ